MVRRRRVARPSKTRTRTMEKGRMVWLWRRRPADAAKHGRCGFALFCAQYGPTGLAGRFRNVYPSGSRSSSGENSVACTLRGARCAMCEETKGGSELTPALQLQLSAHRQHANKRERHTRKRDAAYGTRPDGGAIISVMPRNTGRWEERKTARTHVCAVSWTGEHRERSSGP